MPGKPGDANAIYIPKDRLKLTRETYQNCPITFEKFEQALQKHKPSVNKKDLGKYEQWTKDFGMNA